MGAGRGQRPAGRFRPQERRSRPTARERPPIATPRWPPSSRPGRSSNSSATSRPPRWSSSAAASTRRSTTSPTTSRPRRGSRTPSANLRNTKVLAPIDGVATQVPQIELGRVAPAGQPVFAVVADKGLWVDANPKESDMTYVREGMPATVTIDAFPGQESGAERSARSRRGPARSSRSCRRRTPAATGSRSSSACRCASASARTRTRRTCAPA